MVRFGKERMGDLYLGLSILIGLSFIKVLLVFGRTPLWIFMLSAIPLMLILWNLIQMWRGDYKDAKKLEMLCRNTLFINLSITMILTIQQTLLLYEILGANRTNKDELGEDSSESHSFSSPKRKPLTE